MNNKRALWIAAIVLAGLGVRLAGLNFGVPSKNLALTTYHPDEPLSFYTIEKWKPSKLYFHPGRAILWGGFHLFPMAAGLKLAQIAGYVHVGSRDFYIQNLKEADRLYHVARLLQVLCAAASILVLFWIVEKLLGMTAALLAAFFLAFSTVHIVNSFLTRPDAMMLFLALCSLALSLKLWDNPSPKISLLCGAILGLATATKYNAAPYGIFPLLLHLFSPSSENRRNVVLFLGAGLVFFLLGVPYMILDFAWFRQQLLLNVSMVSTAITPVIGGPGWKTYVTYFLPYGIGWPLVAAGLGGILWTLFTLVRAGWSGLKSDSSVRLNALWLSCSLIVYLVISLPKSQQVWYVLPVLPIFLLYSARFCALLLQAPIKPIKVAGWAVALFVSGYTAVYAMANLSLYTQKNVREDASDWIVQNIPAGETIGIVRSYFWTPAVLRQYQPPYRLLQGGNEQSFIDDAVLGLAAISNEARYLVLTEYEYRVYLDSRFGDFYQPQAQVLNRLMGEEYREIMRFNHEARFLGITFPKKNDAPYDWILPNPEIRIFERVHDAKKS